MAQQPRPQSSSSSAAVTFANPLPQSPRSDILEWRFPAPHHNLTLIGRSRAAWHTSFIIPQLSLLLDAGLCVNAQRPKHIFLTHGHSDHCLLTPAFVNKNREKGGEDVYCPREMAEPLGKFITGSRECNWSGDEDAKRKSEGKAGGYKIFGVKPGDLVQLGEGQGQGLKGWSVEVVKCDHTIPCVGYIFGVTTRRLKDEFKGLKGDQIKKLREKEGVEVTGEVRTEVFGFLGDTTTKPLEEEGGGGLLGGALKRGIKVVITECSFLWEEHRAQAEKTKHTIWGDLEKVVRRWPGTIFVLMHFSMRYSNEDVAKFFKEMENPPGNIVVWADGEI